MDKKDAPLDGITVNGFSGAEYVEKQKAEEIDTVRREELSDLAQQQKTRLSLPFEIQVGRERQQRQHYTNRYVPHRRAIHLTDTQIRKEYGVMSKPLRSKVANVLECLRLNDGPMTNQQLAAATGYPLKFVQQTTSDAFRWREKLLGMAIDKMRDTDGRQINRYSIDEAEWMSADVLLHYINAEALAHKKLLAKERTPDKRGEPAQIASATAEEVSNLSQAIVAAIGKELGMQVVVSGRVELVIRVEKAV